MRRSVLLYLLLSLMAGFAMAEGPAPEKPATCAELAKQGLEAFSRLADQVEAERKTGGGVISDRLAACGLDYEALHQQQCGKAYSQQNLEFLLRHCRFEAWSLARSQCERSQDAISPRYAEFCRAFGRE